MSNPQGSEAEAVAECRACFKTSETVPVNIRWGERGEPWVESSIRRCANDECWNTTGGTLEERFQHVQNVYDYKYFGDYVLSPEQADAVMEAKCIAKRAAEFEARALKAEAALAEAAEEARRYASHYSQGSDGRNTFVMLAERIESLSTIRETKP